MGENPKLIGIDLVINIQMDRTVKYKNLKMRFRKFFIAIVFGAPLVVFNNCTGGFESKSNLEKTSSLNQSEEIRFQNAKDVLRQHCLSCHNSNSAAKNFDFHTVEEFIESGFVKANKIDESILLTRTIHYSGDTQGPRDMPKGSTNFSVADFEILKLWVENIGNNSAFGVSAETLFQCNPSAELLDNKLNRLSKVELTNTYKDLLAYLKVDQAASWSTLAPVIKVLPDDNSEKFERNDRRLFSSHVKQHFKLAELFSDLTSMEEFSKAFSTECDESKNIVNDSNCLNDFIENFGVLVYRRPVLLNEKSSLIDFFNRESKDHKALITRMLMAPSFLYHLENQGSKASSINKYYQLTSYELASRISYLYIESMPPKELLELAKSNELLLDEGIEKAVDLLFEKYSQRVTASLRRYYSQWMTLKRRPGFKMTSIMATKIKKYPEVGVPDENLRTEFVNELLDLTEHYTFTEAGRFSDLLTSNRSFAKTPRLASIYNVPQMKRSDEVIEFNDNERSGIFTRAGLLYSGNDHTNPIVYGVAMIRDFKCEKIGNPPFNLIDANRVLDTKSMTTREVVHTITSEAACIGCHSKINPYGFAAEAYDFLGGYRGDKSEGLFDSNGTLIERKPTSSEAFIEASPGHSFLVKDAVEMSEKLSSHRRVDACFIKNVTEFAFRRNVLEEVDGCSMRNLYKKMDDAGGSLKSMFKAISLEPTFRLKVVSEE